MLGAGDPDDPRLGAALAAAVRRRAGRRHGLGDGRRRVHRRAAAGGDGLQGGRPAPDRRTGRRVRRGGRRLLDVHCSSPASTPCSPASPTRSPTNLPDPGATVTPISNYWFNLASSFVLAPDRRLHHRPHRRAAPGPRGRPDRDGARTTDDVARCRGAEDEEVAPALRANPSDLAPELERRRNGAACGSAGSCPLGLVAADPRRRAPAGLAVAQRGGRVPAGVAAAGLDGVHRLRAVPRAGARLRLRRRDAEAAPPTCRR